MKPYGPRQKIPCAKLEVRALLAPAAVRPGATRDARPAVPRDCGPSPRGAMMLQLMSMLPLSNENGLARTPPLGWRSWNLYGPYVSQTLIESIMDGMVRRDRSVDGVPTSLCDLGYCDVGLDDNWQQCGRYVP